MKDRKEYYKKNRDKIFEEIKYICKNLFDLLMLVGFIYFTFINQYIPVNQNVKIFYIICMAWIVMNAMYGLFNYKIPKV